jgi:SSS family solute:Na+ symporter
MDLPIFIALAFGIQIICFFVASSSSKQTSTEKDYFLAGKTVKFFPLMMTLVATQIGGGLMLGSSEEAYTYGWSVLLYPLGASLGFLLLGIGLGGKLAQFPISTVAQLFELVYGSAKLKKLASVLSIISLFMILTAQIIASHKFMIGVGLDSLFWFCVIWGMIIAYTAVGGLKGVIAIDMIQAAFFTLVFLICFGYLAFSNSPLSEVVSQGLQSDSFAFDPSKFWGWFLMPLLFMVIEQDMGQRCFAAKSPRTVSQASSAAALLTLIVGAIPVFIGIFAKINGITVPPGSSVLMVAIAQTTTPLMTTLVGVAITAVLISTAVSLINAISSNVAQDFDLSFVKIQPMRLIQAITGVIALAALFFSFYFNNVVDLLIQSYELFVSCFFASILMAILRKRGNSLSAFLSFAAGAAAFGFFRFFPSELPKEVCSLLISFAGYAAGELWQRMQTAPLTSKGGVYEK